MGIDAGEDGIQGVVHVLLVGDVLPTDLVLVAFASSEVHHEAKGRVTVESHHEVVRRDIPMHVAVAMQHLQSVQHLQGQDHRGLQSKGPSAQLQHVLQTRTEHRHDHVVELRFLPILVDLGKPLLIGIGVFDALEDGHLGVDLGFFDMTGLLRPRACTTLMARMTSLLPLMTERAWTEE